MQIVEDVIGKIAKAQERLQAGALSKEAYDRQADASRKEIADIAAKDAGSAAVQTSAARAYIQLGDYDTAVEHAGRAHTLAPDDPFPLTTRARAHFERKDFPQAAADAKQALALDPKDPVAWSLYNLSKGRPAGGSEGNLDPAPLRPRESASLPELRGARAPSRAQEDPELAAYKSEQGRALARQVIGAEKALRRKDFLTAYGLADRALSTYAQNPRAQAARAVAAWNLKDYATAVADATAVLRAEPGAYPMLIARAAAYNDTGRHADALRDAEKAVALAPQSARALLERALAKESLQESPDAVLADYKRAAELDPSLTMAYDQALARLAPANARRSLGIQASPAGGARPSPWGDIPGWKKLLGLMGLLGLGSAGAALLKRD